jgi:hypothetical protein
MIQVSILGVPELARFICVSYVVGGMRECADGGWEKSEVKQPSRGKRHEGKQWRRT